jgi:hypothetical protein
LSGSAEKAEGPSISYAPKSALDGRGGSIWIPKLVHTPENTRRGIIEFSQAPEDMLQIHFSSEQEVKLVCVVNGLANSYQNYENWGRVRTVKVWSDDASGIQTSVLQTLGSDTFPNAQFAARDLALSKDLSMQLVDAYSGLTIESFDPDVCLVKGQLVDAPNSVKPTVQPRFEQGCLVPPDSRAGISSIYLYVEQ